MIIFYNRLRVLELLKSLPLYVHQTCYIFIIFYTYLQYQIKFYLFCCTLEVFFLHVKFSVANDQVIIAQNVDNLSFMMRNEKVIHGADLYINLKNKEYRHK